MCQLLLVDMGGDLHEYIPYSYKEFLWTLHEDLAMPSRLVTDYIEGQHALLFALRLVLVLSPGLMQSVTACRR